MIRERKSISYRSRFGKIIASTQAFFRSVRRARRLMLDAKLEEEHVILATSALVVSNNLMGDSLPPIAERLDQGILGIYAVKSHYWLDLLRLSKDAAIGQWKDNPTVDIYTAQSLTIKRASRSHRNLTVSVDGELHEFKSGIEIESKPKSLKVLMPF
jgi:diacylglycerol kinase family enzyme